MKEHQVNIIICNHAKLVKNMAVNFKIILRQSIMKMVKSASYMSLDSRRLSALALMIMLKLEDYGAG